MALYKGSQKICPIVSIGGGSTPVISTLDATPTTSQQTIVAPSGTDGYSPVIISAVTSAIDSNIQAANIKSGVTILGTQGTYTGSSSTLTTKTITANGTYNASSDNADGYSSVIVSVQPSGTTTITANGTYDVADYASAIVSVSGGSDPIGELFQGQVNADGSYTMPYDLSWTGDIYFNGIKTLDNYSSTKGGAFASYLYHQANQTGRLKCRLITGKVYFPDLEEVNMSYCFNSFLNGQTNVTEVHFPKLYRIQGSSSFAYAFQGMGSNKLHLYFNAFNSTYASSNVSAMGTSMLSGTTGATLHFPSNLSGTITSNFGGTNTVRLFDLPATS